MGGEEQTPIDVCMKLLDPKDAVMHTEISNIPMMNKLALAIVCAEDDEEREFWEEAYRVNVLHPVSKKRKREEAIVKMFASLQLQYQQQMGYAPEQGKKGLFGRH